MRAAGIAFSWLLLFIFQQAVRAELGGAETLELRIARADVVVRARVAPPVAGLSAVSTTELNVLETLKGNAPARLQVALAPSQAIDWKHTSEQGLFLLRKSDEAFSLDANVFGRGMIWLDRARPDVYTMDFEVLQDREAILRVARRAV